MKFLQFFMAFCAFGHVFGSNLDLHQPSTGSSTRLSSVIERLTTEINSLSNSPILAEANRLKLSYTSTYMLVTASAFYMAHRKAVPMCIDMDWIDDAPEFLLAQSLLLDILGIISRALTRTNVLEYLEIYTIYVGVLIKFGIVFVELFAECSSSLRLNRMGSSYLEAFVTSLVILICEFGKVVMS